MQVFGVLDEGVAPRGEGHTDEPVSGEPAVQVVEGEGGDDLVGFGVLEGDEVVFDMGESCLDGHAPG